MRTQIGALLAPLILGGLASVASAQEFCVTCKGPDAKYRCLIGGEPGTAARTSRAQLLCITELAQSGHHASCSVGRTTSEPCEGELRTVMFPDTPDAGALPVAETPPGGESPLPATVELPPAPSPGAPYEGTGEQPAEPAEPTGNVIGNAMKKTWNCLSSLFGDC